MTVSGENKVRLVCDPQSTLASAQPALEAAGLTVRSSASTFRAVLEQRAEPCPFLVVDARHIQPVDHDFFELLRELDSGVFIVAIVPQSRRELTGEVLRMGADTFLLEPFYPEELRMILTRQMERMSQYVSRQKERTERLTVLARFASGVAHEINNPLSVISGWLQVLMSDTSQDSPNWKTYAALQRETDRIATVVRDLLAFSGQAAPNRSLVDVNRLISDVVQSVETSSSNGRVEVVQELAAKLPPVLASEPQLREACRHLLERACRASGTDGRVTIQTACRFGDLVEMRLSDSGAPMPEEVREHLFDPFYAVEHDNSVDGLGLCVSYGIVRGLGGELAVESAAGGTTFVMTLPVATRNGAAAGTTCSKRNGNGH